MNEAPILEAHWAFVLIAGCHLCHLLKTSSFTEDILLKKEVAFETVYFFFSLAVCTAAPLRK